MARLTTADKAWLSANFPGLVVLERPKYSLIEGQLHFHRAYEGVAIEDRYAIRLELPDRSDGLPRLTETSGRLERVLAAHPEFGGRQVELHIYPSWRLCIGAPQDLRLNYLPKPSAELLFERYIVPYFYSQSYFERHRQWPWPHLPHDSYGILTWYVENNSLPGAARETGEALKRLAANGNAKAQNILTRAMQHNSFGPNSKCLCGSGKRHLQCHRQLMQLALSLRFPAI